MDPNNPAGTIPITDMDMMVAKINDFLPMGSPANNLTVRAIRTDANGDLNITWGSWHPGCNASYIDCTSDVLQEDVIEITQSTGK